LFLNKFLRFVLNDAVFNILSSNSNILLFLIRLKFLDKMADFPIDILINIFQRCDPKTRVKCKLVYKPWCKFLNSYVNWPLAKKFQVVIEITKKPHHQQIFLENRRHPFEDSVPTDELKTIVIYK